MRQRGRNQERKGERSSSLKEDDEYRNGKEKEERETKEKPNRIASGGGGTRRRQEGIYEVEESVPSFGNWVSSVSIWRWLDGLQTTPFLWRLVTELSQEEGWFAIILWTTTQFIQALFPAVELYLSSQLLAFVTEAIDSRTIQDQPTFLVIAFLRAICPVFSRLIRWIEERTDNVLSARLRQVFALKVLKAHLKVSLGTASDPDTQRVFQQVSSAIGVSLGGNGGGPGRRGGGGEFSTLARGLSGLFSVIDLIAQGAILLKILRRRQEDRIYAIAALIGFALSRIEHSYTPRGDTWWCKITNEDYLTMQRLARIGTTLQFKSEVEALGLEDHIIKEYRSALSSLGTTSTVHPRKAIRQRFSWAGSLKDLLSHFPTIHLAYTASRYPRTVPLSLATVTLVQQTTNRFAGKVEQLASLSDGVLDEVMGFRNLYELEDMQSDLKDGHETFVKGGGKGMKVEFKNVSFTYPGGYKPSARNLSFKLEQGGLAVVVGMNGGGKSTMLKLLTRLYDPAEGTVLLNDQDARSYKLKDLRSAIAIGWQDYVHFPLTIAQNIALGDASSKFSLDSAIEAAKLGGSHDFISALPDGYSTNLDTPPIGFGKLKNKMGQSLQDRARRKEGEKHREVQLSGGQWNRLALSRTMMRAQKVDLLVFDEPSASLDPKAEYELFQRLNELRAGRTSIYISHRFGAFNKKAGLILFMEGGEIIEQGSHAELISRGGRYAELYNMQASAFVE
ncbi:P-loop containing nucleoside triphosphate hydrolase protein [Meredithblackwellia eburnea MCA 4105]